MSALTAVSDELAGRRSLVCGHGSWMLNVASSFRLPQDMTMGDWVLVMGSFRSPRRHCRR